MKYKLTNSVIHSQTTVCLWSSVHTSYSCKTDCCWRKQVL